MNMTHFFSKMYYIWLCTLSGYLHQQCQSYGYLDQQQQQLSLLCEIWGFQFSSSSQCRINKLATIHQKGNHLNQDLFFNKLWRSIFIVGKVSVILTVRSNISAIFGTQYLLVNFDGMILWWWDGFFPLFFLAKFN